jgi:DNA-binding response OmpR family regulator
VVILIVNHHGSLGKLIGQVALQGGWRVLIADRLENMQAIFQNNRIDLVVCDATPEEEAVEKISRLDFTQSLRNLGLKVPVILFEDEGTEVALDPDLAKGIGGIQIFRKPIHIHEIRNAMEQVKAEILKKKKE